MTVQKRRFFQQLQRLRCGRRNPENDEKDDYELEVDDDEDYFAFMNFLQRQRSNASQKAAIHESNRLINGFEARLRSSFQLRARSRSGLPNQPLQKMFVRVPLGLEAGNTLMVISPDDDALRFPVKVPVGLHVGEEFAVPLPDYLNEDDNDSLSSLYDMVDHCLLPVNNVPRLENGGRTPAKQDIPAWAKEDYYGEEKDPREYHEYNTNYSTRDKTVIVETDFGSALDDFFTPTPEVKAYYRQVSEY